MGEQKKIIVATHRDDIDGIASAALILKVYPDAFLIFTTPDKIIKMRIKFTIVTDLPKPPYCEICIDHHKSNYERLVKSSKLTDKDLVDPNAPSAAFLVAKYFGLDDKISREIVDMANRADRGDVDDNLSILDLIIKVNSSNQEKLKWIAQKLAEHGARIFSDEEFKKEIEKIQPLIDMRNKIKRIVEGLLQREIEVAIFDCRKISAALGRLPPTIFTKWGGKASISIYYIDSGDLKVSVRVGNISFEANKFAERFGGGGHAKAAGIVVKNEYILAHIVKSFVDELKNYTIAYVELS